MLTKTTQRPPISDLIKYRLKFRKKMEELKAEHDARIAKLRAQRDEIDGMIIDFLNETGAKSIKTREGTASTKMLPSTKVVDPEVLMNFVIDQKQFDLLKRAVNTYAVQDYIEKHDKLVPGVNFSRYQTVNVLSPQEPPLKEPTDE